MRYFLTLLRQLRLRNEFMEVFICDELKVLTEFWLIRHDPCRGKIKDRNANV